MKTKNITLQTFAPCFVIILALIGSLHLKGQSLVEFNAAALVSSPVPAVLPVASVAAHLNSTGITRNNVNAVGTNAAFSSSNWPVSPAAAPTGGKYLTFTLTAAPGYVLDLTAATILFDCRRSGSGPNAVHLYTSVGGFSSAANALTTVTPIVSSGGTPVSFTFPNSGVYDNLFSIEIRIYADQANATGGMLRLMNPGAGGNIRITGGMVKPYVMSALPCGATYTKKNTSVTASNAPGAISYRFKFYNSTSGVLVGQLTQSSRVFSLSSVSGLFYNTSYKWTVSVNIGFGFGPESNMNCLMTLAPAQTALPCGVSYSKLNSYTAVLVPGGTLNYRYTFYDINTNAIIAQRTQASHYLYFNTLGLSYNTSYKWTVAVEYPLSAGGSAFGPESNSNCIVTFTSPATTVPCGNTYVLSTGYSAAAPVLGATGYRFRFYQNNVLMAESAQTSHYIYFNQVAGLANDQTYNWTVEVLYNSTGGPAYGPASSSACTVSFGTTARLAGEEQSDQEEVAVREEIPSDNNDAVIPELTVYPNPATDKINIAAGEPVLATYVYAITGELLKTFNLTSEIMIGDLAPGTYFILVQTESGVRRATFVKE